MKEEIFYTDDILKICFYRRGSDTIYAYFSHSGKRYRFSTRTSDLPQAIQIANQKYQEAKEGRSVQVKTLFQVYSEFIEFKQLEGLKTTTIADYESTIQFLYKFFDKSRDIGTIKKRDIGDLVLWRRNYYIDKKRRQKSYKRNGKTIQGKEYEQKFMSNRTINRTVGLLISVLRFACYEREYIQSDKIPSYTRLSENVRQEFIDEIELGLIFTYFVDKNMPYHAHAILFCFYTGCRYPSELNRLQWKHIDFKNKAILFMGRKAKGNRVVNTRFPMLPVIEEVLQECQSWHLDNQPEDYVFRNKSGKQVKNIRKAFLSAITACGLQDKIKSMYGLRHSFATHWIHTKMPLNEIAHLMGHADTVMLERRYAHLVTDKINDHFQETYESLHHPQSLTLVGKSKQHTVLDDDSLEYYRKMIKGETIPPLARDSL